MTSILKRKSIWVLLFIAALSGLFIGLLPDPIDIDLNKIGNGKPSVVFVYDLNRTVSNQQAIEMNLAKEQIGTAANFLIARTGYPATDEFIALYQAEIAELLFFDTSGALIAREYAPMSASSLVNALAVN